MSVKKDLIDVIKAVLILMEAIIVHVWMDMNCNQIITLVQVMIIALQYVIIIWKTDYIRTFHNSRNANLKY